MHTVGPGIWREEVRFPLSVKADCLPAASALHPSVGISGKGSVDELSDFRPDCVPDDHIHDKQAVQEIQHAQ